MSLGQQRRRRRSRPAPELAGPERWAVSYADLVTLLFAFFTTLYAMSGRDNGTIATLEAALQDAFARQSAPPNTAAVAPLACPEPEADPEPPTCVCPDQACPELAPRWSEAEQRAREQLAADLEVLLADPVLAGRIVASPDPRGVRLSLGAAAFFEPGDSQLRPEAKASLSVLGRALTQRSGQLVVEGHTDDTPIRGGRFRSNWELSTARATEVVSMLVEEHHMPAARLSAAGYAEHRPLTLNDTPEGRAHNRRVDIVVIPEGVNHE